MYKCIKVGFEKYFEDEYEVLNWLITQFQDPESECDLITDEMYNFDYWLNDTYTAYEIYIWKPDFEELTNRWHEFLLNNIRDKGFYDIVKLKEGEM